MKKRIVKCPNKCIMGEVKYYPDPKRALFDMKKCSYCKGRGEVGVEEAKQIESELN